MLIENYYLEYAIEAIKEKISRRGSQIKHLEETKEYKGYQQAIQILESYFSVIEDYEYKIRELNQKLSEQPSDLKRIRILEGNVEYLIDKCERQEISLYNLERKLEKIETYSK